MNCESGDLTLIIRTDYFRTLMQGVTLIVSIVYMMSPA